MTAKNGSEATRWQKGTSGNPAGRPRKGTGTDQVKTALRGKTGEEVIKALIKRAKTGNTEAAKLLFSYGFGAAPKEPVVSVNFNTNGPRTPADLHKLTDAELVVLQALLAKAEGLAPEPPPPVPLLMAPPQVEEKAEVLDAEFVEDVPKLVKVSGNTKAPLKFRNSAPDENDPDLKQNQPDPEGRDELWRPSAWKI